MILMFDQWIPVRVRAALCKRDPDRVTSSREGAVSPHNSPPQQPIRDSTDYYGSSRPTIEESNVRLSVQVKA